MMFAKHYAALFFTAALAHVGYAIPELAKKRALAHAKTLAAKHSKDPRHLEDMKRLLAEGCEPANGDQANPLFTLLLNPNTFEQQFGGDMTCTCVETDQRTGVDCELCDGNDYCTSVDGEEFCVGFTLSISTTSSFEYIISYCADTEFDGGFDGELCVEQTFSAVSEQESCEATFDGTACASCVFTNCTDASMTMTGGETETAISVDCTAAGGPAFNECDDDSPFSVGNPAAGSITSDEYTFTCSKEGGGGSSGNVAQAFSIFTVAAAGVLAFFQW